MVKGNEFGTSKKSGNFPYLPNNFEDTRNGKRYNVPFTDFMPKDQTTGYYYNPKSTTKKEDYFSDWKPQSLLEQILNRRDDVLLALCLPFSVLLAAALPSLIKYFMNSYGMSFPTITTTATGNRFRGLMDINPSVIASILETIEKFSEKFADEDSQRTHGNNKHK